MAKLSKDVRACKNSILSSNFVAIDPASGGTSNPGFAYYKAGVLIDSGELPIMQKGATIQDRLRRLADELALNFGEADVLAIEDVKGKHCHEFLKWAIGVTIVGCRAPAVLFVPIPAWKAFVKVCDGYQKSDEADAIAIGATCLALAREL